MPRRRHRRGLYERLASHNDSMSPGTIGGRVSSAAPVLSASDVLAEQAGDIGVVAMSEGEGHYEDVVTLPSDGAQDVDLTYLPVEFSEDVKLRGIGATREVDWTRDGQVLSLLAPLDARTGDELKVQYEYLLGAPVAPAVPFDTFIVADDPLFFFRLGDEPVTAGSTVVDYSGNSRDGLFSGDTLTHVATPGLLVNSGGDGAVSSAGTLSDGVELAYASWMNVTQASWEFWISSTDADGGRIFARESPTYVWSIQGDTTNLYFLASASLIATFPWGGFDGDPHHVVLTYDGTTLRLYVDGAAAGTQAWAGPLPTATDSAITLLHAVGTNVSASLIVGSLDEVAMYDHALTADQVLAHYNAGATP